MGNSSSKDGRAHPGSNSLGHASGPHGSSIHRQQSPADRLTSHIYETNHPGPRASRPDLSFLSIGRSDRDGENAAPDKPRETKQEREARRVEKERQARLKERERSLREEHIDGGYLVTLGTYTGPEDFSKPVVRQLQIERRLAPFWRGLNDHSESWTEAQLVAAARGLPIPAADEVPPELADTSSHPSSIPRQSDSNLNTLAVPSGSRTASYQSDNAASLSTSHPPFSTSALSSSNNSTSANSQLFRGRAKTLASFASGRGIPSSDLTPQETRLPHDPNVHGQAVEAYLYKDASECPICFLYYPPYLNRTRCCGQPMCSECFVQIKRPDPHPPEHEQPDNPRPVEEEAESLVSEIAVCPFCVTPDFGVTYDPPPFRRGLAYANQTNSLKNPSSAMSSSSSLTSGGGRTRATSLSANAPNVVTTDRVRPDWAKKLADARAHALRRSAAATALHNAAYVLGNQRDMHLRGGFGLGRRRRTLFGDSPGGSGSGTPREGDEVGGRVHARRPRVEDLEDLMMAEAIRLSLAAEEERKRKDEKGAHKEAKKKAKEEKKAAKIAKRSGSSTSLYRVGTNDSNSTGWASTAMARSTSNLGAQPVIPEEQIQGKGKQPVQEVADSTARDDAQRHLTESRASLQPSPSAPIPTPSMYSPHLRQLSSASSAASSFIDSAPGSYRGDSNFHSTTDLSSSAQESSAHRSGTPPVESMFNFRSLAAMVDQNKDRSGEHVEDVEVASKAEEQLKEPSPTSSPRVRPATVATPLNGNRSRGDSGESGGSLPPPIYVETPPARSAAGDEDEIAPAPPRLIHDADTKELGSINLMDRGHAHEPTQ